MGEVDEEGVLWEGAEGTSPGLSVVGMSEEEKGGVEEGREGTDG